MSETMAFDPRRFRSAAAHYLAGRPPYSATLIDRVTEIVGLTPADRVMDLGCGPGQLARAFAPAVREVIGVDPEPEMLRIATEMSAALGNVRFRQGSSFDLSPEFGRFRMVTMGRSFHWMDRAETLRRLDGMIEPGGAVVLFHDTHPRVADNAWYDDFRGILDRYSGEDAGRTHRQSRAWAQHEGVLLDSAFCRLETIGITERREIARETLVDRALSMSSTSPSHIGDRAEAMIADVRAAVPAPIVREVVTSQALIARRG